MTRRVLVIAIGFVTAIATAGGCSIHHKSDGYACTRTSDCTGGRRCVDGFCVTSTTSIDASGGGDARFPDASTGCPSACSSCNMTQHTCTIDCTKKDCTNTVTCPAGYKCDIQCNSDGSCRNGINCQLGLSCSIECIARNSCHGVECGTGPCDVSCSGPMTCSGVSCSNSCACDVTCTGTNSCPDNSIECSSIACKAGPGCTSVPLTCHSCQ